MVISGRKGFWVAFSVWFSHGMAQPFLLHFPPLVVLAGHSCTDDDYFTFHSVSFSLPGSLFVDLAWFSFGWLSLTWSFDSSKSPSRGFVFGHHIDFRFPLFVISFFFSYSLSSLSILLVYPSFGCLWSYHSSVDLAFAEGPPSCLVFMHDLTVCIKFPHWFGALVAALSGVSLGWSMQIATEIAYSKTWGCAIATQQGNFAGRH